MNAIVSIGGKQYNVKPGDKILVEKIDKNPGEEIVIKDVLWLKKDNNEIIVGKPTIENAKITANVISHKPGPKLIIFKKRSKKGYKKKIGHRQKYTEIEIKDIKYE